MTTKTCRWPDCERTDVVSHGYCDKCRRRAKKAGTWEEPWLVRDVQQYSSVGSQDGICVWPGCTTKALSRGLCSRDYQRGKLVGTWEEPWTLWDTSRDQIKSKYFNWQQSCRWPECSRTDIHSYGLCPKHRLRALSAGDMDTPWDIWEPGRELSKYFGRGGECRWPDCSETEMRGHGLCMLHYSRGIYVDDLETPWIVWAERCTRTCAGCGVVFTSPENVASRVNFCSRECNGRWWRTNNRDKRVAAEEKRRAAKLGVTVSEVDIVILMESSGTCYLCEEIIDYGLSGTDAYGPHLDHIVPLKQGGSHTVENLAYTHAWCNLMKGARTPEQHYERLRALVAYLFKN